MRLDALLQIAVLAAAGAAPPCALLQLAALAAPRHLSSPSRPARCRARRSSCGGPPPRAPAARVGVCGVDAAGDRLAAALHAVLDGAARRHAGRGVRARGGLVLRVRGARALRRRLGEVHGAAARADDGARRLPAAAARAGGERLRRLLDAAAAAARAPLLLHVDAHGAAVRERPRARLVAAAQRARARRRDGGRRPPRVRGAPLPPDRLRAVDRQRGDAGRRHAARPHRPPARAAPRAAGGDRDVVGVVLDSVGG